MPDGNLTFDTKIDEQGFNKGAKNLSSKTLDLKNKISDVIAQIKNLQTELEKTGNVKVKTKTVENLESNIEKARQKLSDLYAEADKIGDAKQSELRDLGFGDNYLDEILAQDKAWQKVQEKITQTESALNSYERQLKSATDSAPLTKDTAAYKQKEQRLNELMGKLGVYKAKLSETEQAERSNASQTVNAGQKSVDYKNKLKQTVSALKMLSNGVKKVYSGLKNTFSNTIGKGIKNLTNHFKRANRSTNILEKSLRRIKNLIVSMFLLKLVHSPFDAVKDGLGEISKISPVVNRNLSNIKSSFDYLKNSLATVAAPLLNLVAPAFVKLTDTVAGAIDKIAQLAAVLSGQSTYIKAVKVQKDYAASLDDTTENVEENTKAVEDNQKNLAGYDELNVMQQDSNSSSGASSATSSTPAYTNVEVPVSGLGKSLLNAIKSQNWSAIGELCGEKINEALSKVNWTKIKSTAKKWGANIASFLNGAMKTTDWNLVGKTAAEGVNTIVSFISNFSYTFDWSSFGYNLRKTLVSFFTTLDAEEIKNAFVYTINGLITAGLALIGDPKDFKKWGDEVGQKLVDAINEITWGDLASLFARLLSGIFNFGDGLVNSIDWNDFGKSVKKSFEDFFGEGGDGYQLIVDMSDFFKDTLIGLLTAVDAIFDGTDWRKEGQKVAKGFQELDFEELLGKDSVIGRILNSLQKILIAGLDFAIGFFEEPGTADKVTEGIKKLVEQIKWKIIILKAITLIINCVGDIIQLGERLIEELCKGLANGFKDGEDDDELKKAAKDLIKAIGNLIITVFESALRLIVNGVLNIFITIGKLVFMFLTNLLADILSVFGPVGIAWGNTLKKNAFNYAYGEDSEPWDVDIKIPRLATGTVVPANYGEFLAVLGDNKREQEFVAPESAMKKAFLEALAESGSNSGDGETVINLNVDGETWFSWLVNKNNQYKRAHGASAF